MAWVVDTSVVLDLVVINATGRNASAACLQRHLADVLIAAFADRFQGIIPRNASDFRSILPALTVIEP